MVQKKGKMSGTKDEDYNKYKINIKKHLLQRIYNIFVKLL